MNNRRSVEFLSYREFAVDYAPKQDYVIILKEEIIVILDNFSSHKAKDTAIQRNIFKYPRDKQNNLVLFDDVGSYPTPNGFKRRWIEDSIECNENEEEIYEIIKKAFLDKIRAGVDVPTYPQFRNMNSQFLNPIKKEEEPYLIREENANIKEIELIEEIGRDIFEETGERIKLRVCITGPIELYLGEFGGRNYFDILKNLSKSIDRFAKNSILNKKQIFTHTISIDEPSIGLNPEINFSSEEIAEALSLATEGINVDTEIHLHSSIYYKTICEVEGIDVIGVETASDMKRIRTIDKDYLERYDKFLRVGIARTDISSLSAEINEKYDINVWMNTDSLWKVFESESVKNIRDRLNYAYREFGDLIRYVGPDCGLGSWPSQEMAFQLLKTVRTAIDIFRKDFNKMDEMA
ncbi:MAG: 5-methyltetrahydropteroyltriglutamate--homocysteine methyltransferase [Candidatus Methanolliviera sp. GoM_asphalt]|nr:MAG: 5-methyltetrahydropteroyltriglutamate--homocysteine methyltransferase [Candidatus Methanolliviera sp. GoM_asphalt]